MSKGSKQRPTDRKKFSEGYDRIFGKKLKPVEITVDGHTFDKFKVCCEQDNSGRAKGETILINSRQQGKSAALS